jgi:hypothetical protein
VIFHIYCSCITIHFTTPWSRLQEPFFRFFENFHKDGWKQNSIKYREVKSLNGGKIVGLSYTSGCFNIFVRYFTPSNFILPLVERFQIWKYLLRHLSRWFITIAILVGAIVGKLQWNKFKFYWNEATYGLSMLVLLSLYFMLAFIFKYFFLSRIAAIAFNCYR